MLEITSVEPHGIGAELGLETGDRLLSVNGHPVRDLIDARFYLADAALLLEVEKATGQAWELDLELGDGDELGLEFAHPEPSRCGNNCLFCYVHQLPKGLRPSLYVKDEDYRFSFLYGSYVTLANLSAADLERILHQRLSPLYISVHATDKDVRNRLLGKDAPPLLPLLRDLVGAGIHLHTQIVLCPGINDGAVLDDSIAALAELRPGVESLAVVPVGLTGHRQGLPVLRTPTPVEAAAVIDQVQSWQQRLLPGGGRFVFAADEFYLKAACEIPAVESYEDFPQLENGIGLIASFRAGIPQALVMAADLSPMRVSTITGRSFFAELKAFAAELHRTSGIELEVHEVPSRLFAGEISVAGLIGGQDILSRLRGIDLGAGLLLPDIVLRDGSDQLLDNLRPGDLARELASPVITIVPDAGGIVAGIRQLAGGGVKPR